MLHDYIQHQLLQKNRGVYFKKGKWLIHVFGFFMLWLLAAFKLKENNEGAYLTGNMLWAAFWTMLPFMTFFYIYCLYLIPFCFKRNLYARFWTILVVLLLIFPWIGILFRVILEPYFEVLRTDRSQLSLFSFVLQTYGSFLASFTGFTSLLYIMELLEHIRTSKEIQSHTRQMAVTELHLLKTNMNSDFMVRSLDGIIQLAEQGDGHAPEAIVHFSDILRYRLYRSNKNWVALQEELEHMANLFAFQNSIHPGEDKALLEVEGEPALQFVIPLSLITIAEPLFTTYQTEQDWSLLVYILIEEKEMQIAIELTTDDGSTAQKLETIKERLYRLWNSELIFTVETDKNNYSVRTCIPILTNSTASS